MTAHRRRIVLLYALWIGVPAAVAATAGWAAFADDKVGWTLAAVAAAALAGAFGPTAVGELAAWQKAYKDRKRTIRLLNSAHLPESVAWLLYPAKAVVPFFGREGVLHELETWAADPGATAVRLLAGAGGVGKTRLAREFEGRLPEWQCEWVRPQSETQAAELITSGSLSGRSLFVVDYAEARQRSAVAALMCAAQQASEVRVLLLARSAGPWWQTLSAAFPEQAHLVDALTGSGQVVEVPAKVDDGHDARMIVADAMRAFADHLRLPVPVMDMAQHWPADTPVLRLHAAALVQVLDGAYRHGPFDVLEEVLRHEARYWRFAARRAGLVTGDDLSADAMLQQVVGLAAMMGAAGRGEVAGVVRRVPRLAGADQERVDAYALWLEGLYPAASGGESALGLVQPDLLAETLAVRVPREYDHDERIRVFTGLSAAQAVRTLTVLGRARAHHPADADALIEVALSADLKTMVEAVVRVGVQFPGVFGDRAVAATAGAEIDLAWARRVADRLPRRSMELGQLALTLTTRIVEGFAADTPIEDRARWTIAHARRLAAEGQRAEALAVSNDAVDLCRTLTARDRDAYLPDLATAVNTRAVQLADIGRPEALSASEEALGLRRELAALNRGAHLPDLATSVSNLANRLGEAGRRFEALSLSEEAVALRRELAAADRETYLPAFAVSVHNHAVRLAEAGRRSEAFAYSEEAVRLREELVDRNRDAYLPNLANSLNNHARRLAEAGQLGALDAIRKAVELYREVAARNPGRYQRYLANALSNLGFVELKVGHVSEEGIGSTEEGVRYFDDLALREPDAVKQWRRAAMKTLAQLREAAARASGLAPTGRAEGGPEHAARPVRAERLSRT